MKRRLLILGMPIAVGSPWAALAQATDTPPAARPIRIIVPYPAGGPVDAAARQLARGMADHLKQTVIVENKPGAGSTIGAAEVAKSAPDGHTVLFSLPDSFTYVPQLFRWYGRLPPATGCYGGSMRRGWILQRRHRCARVEMRLNH